MSNLLFPKIRGLAWSVVKNPTFSTEIQQSLAGREVRVQNFQNPIWEFTLTYEYLLNDPRIRDENGQTPLEALVGFFLARGGQFDDFLLNETDLTGRLEDSVYSGQPIGTGNGYVATPCRLPFTDSRDGVGSAAPPGTLSSDPAISSGRCHVASNPISASQVTSDQVSTIVATVTEVVSAIEGIVAASGVGNALSIAQIEQLTKLFGNLAGVAVQAAHNIFGRDITPESVMELMPVGTALAKPTE